jgi:hypothetical protein
MKDQPVRRLSRRRALAALAGAAAAFPASSRGAPHARFALARFSADVTVPVGHPLMGGGIAPASRVDDPLSARGIVLLGGSKPIVLAAVDWCEIRNQAYDQWRTLLAEAAATEPENVLVASVHQHDAPIVDLEAQQILQEHHCQGRICDLPFHHQAVRRVAQSLRDALRFAEGVTHVGVGQAKVDRIASNRRYRAPDGSLRFDRTSSTRDAAAHDAEEGTIDPWLKSLSFWNADRPLAVLSAYATHPMSYYGQGAVSSDFVGLAREMRTRDEPGVHQVYFSGASGNVTAGKYNDGSLENRSRLAERLHGAMRESFRECKRHALERVELRRVELRLAPRTSPGFTEQDLETRLGGQSRPFDQCLAAMGLSWRRRVQRGQPLDLTVLDLGAAQFALLPGESYVEHQLKAQELAGRNFVMVSGYGECAPGYLPIEQAWVERDTNLRDWCWVDPGAEAALTGALEKVIRRG